MNRSKYVLSLFFTVFVLSGCVTSQSCGEGGDVRLFRTPTEYMVNNGIKNYEDGNYTVAMSILQALVENKAATKGEKVLAYKYLAFIHCVSPSESRDVREKMCRESFKKAFDLNPNFSLSQAEAGHPVWGPVFSSVRNKLSK